MRIRILYSDILIVLEQLDLERKQMYMKNAFVSICVVHEKKILKKIKMNEIHIDSNELSNIWLI